MARIWIALGVLLAQAWTGVGAARAQERPLAFVGAHLIPIDGDEVEQGVLVIADGKIAAVGRAGEVELPPDAEVIDATGRVIMPGLVDTHSHVGGIGGADGSGPIQPGVRVMDSINVRDAGFRRVVAGGLTTLNIMPGSGHLSSGQTVYCKMRFWREPDGSSHARAIEDIAIRDTRTREEGGFGVGTVMGGLKMANGTNSQRNPPFPGTRGKSASLVREKFIAAQEYAEKIERADGDPEKMPARDLDMEALVEVMEGRRIVHHHTHRADDIMTVLRLADEFGFRVVLHHVSEGWRVADEIASFEGVPGPDGTAWGAPCSVILVDSPGGKLEARHLVFETPGILEKAGARVALHTDDWITDSRYFLRMPAISVRAGMSREAALRAVTLSGAEMLDLGDRVGSLTPGKDADFVVLDGDPLSVYTKVRETWVEGHRVFDRDDPDDRLHAVGGYGAAGESEPYFCCYQHLIGEGQ